MFLQGTNAASIGKDTVIVCPAPASNLEAFAAREVRRYVFLRTGDLLPIVEAASGGDAIVVARKDRDLLQSFGEPADVTQRATGLGQQDYLLRSLDLEGGHHAVCLVGGSATATLYAAYRFAEHLGIRFYLHGDVVPDIRKAIEWPTLDELASPLFELRGIQPFHDFPEGPDWWSTDDYKAIIAQLPKMRMNFIGLHTYPIVEPTVWIGRTEDIGENGRVAFGYPTRYFNTALTVGFGYTAKKTSDYCCGAAALFDRDDYSSDIMRGLAPEPHTPEECNEVFNRAGDLLRESFGLAHLLGVKTCVGTETPLAVPEPVRNRLGLGGEAPDRDQIQKIYEGIFLRIMKTHPLDYYWFWTPETWTWEGTKEEDVQRTVEDITTARLAAEKVGAPFSLATCGWVLGPDFDRAYLGKALPGDIAVSCISRKVGHDPVDPAFAEVKGRAKWAIPWLEDDPAMTSPQLWAGRMRRDAQDALAYGCNGLMGIHWRTRVIGPNVAVLGQAAWDLSAATVEAFYADWALHEFGPEAAEGTARIFSAQDGKLPRPSDWIGGPGGYKPDKRPWEEVKQSFAFVGDFGALRPLVAGPGNLERFDYWLHTFQFLRATGRMRCAWGAYEKAMESVRAEANPKARSRIARESALPLREELVTGVEKACREQLAAVNTSGEMGTLCNLEQHSLSGMLDAPGEELAEALGSPLPASAQLSREYKDPPRLFVPTIRSCLLEGEPLAIKAILLDKQPAQRTAIHWRSLGSGPYSEESLVHAARGVYTARLSAGQIGQSDFEYYIEAVTLQGKILRWPATAPQINQTVVVMPR
jgi:hypothetical protein